MNFRQVRFIWITTTNRKQSSASKRTVVVRYTTYIAMETSEHYGVLCNHLLNRYATKSNRQVTHEQSSVLSTKCRRLREHVIPLCVAFVYVRCSYELLTRTLVATPKRTWGDRATSRCSQSALSVINTPIRLNVVST